MMLAIFILSISAVFASFLSPALSDIFLLAAPMAIASMIIALCNEQLRRIQRLKDNRVVIDGSNVMHWHRGQPNLETVRKVIGELRKKGFSPGVVFDANAGHVLTGKFRDENYFRRALGLEKDFVMVVQKGTQADPMILKAAQNCKGRVVSNDKFRDWVRQHPELDDEGYVIRGGFRSGKLWLGLPELR